MKCAICGSENDVKRVGSNTFWCNKCIQKGLDEANRMNETERNADTIEEWLLNSERDTVSATNIQRVLKVGLIKANEIIEQLINRGIVEYDSKTGKHKVIRK